MKRDQLTADIATAGAARSNQVLDALLRDLLAEVRPDADPEIVNASLSSSGNAAKRVPESLNGYTAAVTPAQADWAQTVFPVLKFRIGKIEWAAPLVLLECVAQVPKTVTVLPGQPVWHLGMISLRNKTRVVIDLSRFLALENPPVDLQDGYLIAMGDGEFMLHCDALGDSVRVPPASVRWRRSSATPWFAGVLPDSLNVLLDVNWLVAQFRHD